MQIKIFQNKKDFHKGHVSSKPSFFWMLILLMVTIIMALSFVFGVLLFLKINKEPTFSAEDLGDQVDTINQKKLDSVLQYFDDREKKSEQIRTSPSPLVDPSI